MLKHVCVIPTRSEKIAKLVEEAVREEYNNESIVITLHVRLQCFEVEIEEGVNMNTYISISAFCKGYTQALMRYI